MTRLKPRVAVVFVPGIFASHVIDPRDPKGVMWPINRPSMLVQILNSPKMQRGKLEGRDHFVAFNPKQFERVNPARGWQTVYLDGYKNFLKDCENNRDLPFTPVVYAAGYNFTRSNRRTAIEYVGRMARTALSESGVTGVLYVTHSMGCLPVRALLHMTPELREACAGVIHVAAPHEGAPEIIARYVRGVLSDDRAIRGLFGNAGWKAATTASAIPGAFELMPAIRTLADRNRVLLSVGLAPGFDSDDPLFLKALVRFHFGSETQPRTELRPGVRGSRARFRSAVNLRTRMLADIGQFTREAMAFRRWLGTYYFPRTGSVVLTGLPTVQKIRFDFEPATPANSPPILTAVHLATNAESPQDPDVTNDGDGTVPKRSQEGITNAGLNILRADQLREVSGIEHSVALEQKTDVYRHVYDFMKQFFAEYQTTRNSATMAQSA